MSTTVIVAVEALRSTSELLQPSSGQITQSETTFSAEEEVHEVPND